MPFYIFVAANLEKIHSSVLSRQKCELVVGEGEAVLLSSKGLPYNGVNLHVPDVDTGNHVGLHRGNPAKESLGGLTVTCPFDLVDRARNLLKLSLPGKLVVSHPGVVADNIQVDLLHSGHLPAELGNHLPVRGDGDAKLKVRGSRGHLGPGQVDGEVLARGKVHGVAGLLGGGVEVNSGHLLAVELELLGGSGAGDLHGLDLGEVGLNLELLARGVPGRHDHLILACDVPGDGEETTDGLAEPDHGVGGGPGVKLFLAEFLATQSDCVLEEELSKKEVPVLLLVGDGPLPPTGLVVPSKVEVVPAIEGAHLGLNNLVHSLHLELVGVVDEAVVTNPVPDGNISPLQLSVPLASAVSRVLPLVGEQVVLGVSVWAVEEFDVLLGLGVVEHKLRDLLTIKGKGGVHLHLGNEDDALVDLVKEDGHLPLDVLSVPASVPVHHSVERRFLSHGHLVKVLHLELGSIVGLDIEDPLGLLDDVLTVGDLVGQGEASVGGVLPATLVGPGLVHVVGKVGEEEGSLGGGVVVLDVVPGLAIKDVVLLNLHLVDHLSLVDLVEEDVPGVLHLGPLSASGDHSVHPVEGALLGDNEGVLSHQLELLSVVHPLVFAITLLHSDSVHLEVIVVLEPGAEVHVPDEVHRGASLGGKAHLELLGRGLSVKLHLGLALVLHGILDVVLHHVVEHNREHTAHLSVTLQLHEGIVLVLVLDNDLPHGVVLLHGPLGVNGSIDISSDVDSPHTRWVQVKVKSIVLASELRVHLQVELHLSLVQVSDTSPLLSVDGGLDGHLLARDAVDLQLPLVVLLEVEEHVQLGLPVGLDGDVKEGLGHHVVVVNGDLGLPHTALHLPVENEGSLLGPVSQEHGLLDELVVHLHVKETVDGRATVELNVQVHVVKGGVPDEPGTRNLDMGTSALEGVGGVVVLQLEEDTHGGEVELLVPFSGAPLQPETRLLWSCQEALEVVDDLLHRDDGSLGRGQAEGRDQQQA